MNNYLINIITPLFLSSDKKISIIIKTKEKVKWVPILLIDTLDNSYMGIIEKGFWVVDSKVGLHILDSINSYIAVMVLLEKPIEKIKNTIEMYFASKNIFIDVYNIFPFNEIIMKGFEQKSDYWASLALKWYDELPEEMKVIFKEELYNITISKWGSQKLRHKAIKELKKLNL